MIHCKRVYEAPAPDDGYRLLVDRLWPRGCRRDSLVLDDWRRELGPSAPVRQAFGHRPACFAAFRTAYRAELAAHPEYWMDLLDRARRGPLTLLYAAKDEALNNARVLAEWLEEAQLRQQPGSSPVCYGEAPE